MSELPINHFTATVEEALNQYQDPTWLGANSPLATPYFLGEHLVAAAATAVERGRTLQKLLVAATDEISGKYADRYQTILREYYFQDRPAAVVWDQIGLTKNSFHLSRNAAIAALEGVLIAYIQPALRLEQPLLPTALVERERVLAHCRDLLATPKTVALSGPGGIGKTALAAQLAQESNRPSGSPWRPSWSTGGRVGALAQIWGAGDRPGTSGRGVTAFSSNPTAGVARPCS